MYKNYFFLTFSLLVLMFACEKEEDPIDPTAPLACFTAPEENLFAGIGIAFNSECSANSESYMWDFGDGNTSLEAHPIHKFKEEGTYKVTLIVTDMLDKTSTTSMSLSIHPSPFIEHSGYIDEAEVWEEGYHLVRSSVKIRHGSLRIMPGAQVYVNVGSNIYVGDAETANAAALLIAEGTADKPVIFKPSSGAETPGAWGHVFFTGTASPQSKLSHCTFLFGGKTHWSNSSNFDEYNKHGFIELERGTSVAIDNCKIIGAANWGIKVKEEAKFNSFSNNLMQASVSYPLWIDLNSVHTIGAGNTFETESGVLATGQWFREAGVSWKKLNVPYIIDFGISFSGFDPAPSLNLEPGVVLAFKTGYGLGTGAGSLNAEGTATDPVIFTGITSATGQVSQWSGIGIGAGSVLRHCIIEYAGGELPNRYSSAVNIDAASSTVFEKNIIKQSAGRGVDINGDTWNITFENNQIENCYSYGIETGSDMVHLVSLSNKSINTAGFGIGNRGIEGHITWPVRPEPYSLTSTIYLQSYDNCSLTLPPGTHLQMQSGVSIHVGNDNFQTGALIAEGTADKPIVITLATADKEAANGTWGTILFGKGATSTSKIRNCVLEYGGSDGLNGYHGRLFNYGIVHFYDTDDQNSPIVENNRIANSSSYGISTYNANPSVTNNIFENNSEGDIVDVTL